METINKETDVQRDFVARLTVSMGLAMTDISIRARLSVFVCYLIYIKNVFVYSTLRELQSILCSWHRAQRALYKRQ